MNGKLLGYERTETRDDWATYNDNGVERMHGRELEEGHTHCTPRAQERRCKNTSTGNRQRMWARSASIRGQWGSTNLRWVVRQLRRDIVG